MIQAAHSIDAAVDDWQEITIALNQMSRSLGVEDAYPFGISDRVRDKLRFVDGVLGEQGLRAP